MDAKKIFVKTHEPLLKPIEVIPNGDWIDLRSAECVDMKKGDYRLLSLGVSMQLPDGYEGHLALRSSTFKKFGIIQTNAVGIIDNSYCGNDDVWRLAVYATRDTRIPFNERIAQFRIVEKQPVVQIEYVDHLNNENRGGFGSTDQEMTKEDKDRVILPLIFQLDDCYQNHFEYLKDAYEEFMKDKKGGDVAIPVFSSAEFVDGEVHYGEHIGYAIADIRNWKTGIMVYMSKRARNILQQFDKRPDRFFISPIITGADDRRGYSGILNAFILSNDYLHEGNQRVITSQVVMRDPKTGFLTLAKKEWLNGVTDKCQTFIESFATRESFPIEVLYVDDDVMKLRIPAKIIDEIIQCPVSEDEPYTKLILYMLYVSYEKGKDSKATFRLTFDTGNYVK